MKRILGVMVLASTFQASMAFGAMVQDWTNISGGAAGTYQDSTGSKIEFTTDTGPKGGQKALKLTSNLVANGYVGVYTNASGDISKAANLVFMVKSTVAGDIQLAIKDAFNVQYIEKVTVSAGDWAPVTAFLAGFMKDPYYTPPDAISGHPMDFSKISNLNFSPQMAGASVILIGPVETAGTASASAGKTGTTSASTGSSSSSAPTGTGPAVNVLDFTGLDSKAAGTFQDSQGSSFAFAVKDNPNKKGKQYLTINCNLAQGGYCGMWCRAGGADWSGANLSAAKSLSIMIYSKDPVVLGIALKDKSNNQYVADAPSTKGGKWETVSIPLDSFKLDPYYTPPDAVKGAAKDFSKVTTFNIQPKTVGKLTLAVDSITAK